MLLLQSGRAADASRVAEEIAVRIAEGSGDLPGNERFLQGAVEGLFYALGRPTGPAARPSLQG